MPAAMSEIPSKRISRQQGRTASSDHTLVDRLELDADPIAEIPDVALEDDLKLGSRPHRLVVEVVRVGFRAVDVVLELLVDERA